MTTIEVTPGQPNTVTINRPIRPGFDVGPSLELTFLDDLRLTVTQAGQTRWNIGGGELRHHLFVNGIKATRNVDYTINLPYLDWLSPVSIDSGDELILVL